MGTGCVSTTKELRGKSFQLLKMLFGIIQELIGVDGSPDVIKKDDLNVSGFK